MKIGQGANKKNLCLAKSHFFFSLLKIGGQLKQKLIMYFVYHKREDPFNQFKGCVLHYSCIRSACGVRPHPQNDSGSTHNHIFHFMEAEFRSILDLIHNCLFLFLGGGIAKWEFSFQNIKRKEVRERKREQKELQRQMEVRSHKESLKKWKVSEIFFEHGF